MLLLLLFHEVNAAKFDYIVSHLTRGSYNLTVTKGHMRLKNRLCNFSPEPIYRNLVAFSAVVARCKTHGDTYKEALNNILEVIELWIEAAEEAGETVPQPQIIAA